MPDLFWPLLAIAVCLALVLAVALVWVRMSRLIAERDEAIDRADKAEEDR